MSATTFIEEDINDLILKETRELLNENILQDFYGLLEDNDEAIETFFTILSLTGGTKYLPENAIFFTIAQWNFRRGDYLGGVLNLLSAARGIGNFVRVAKVLSPAIGSTRRVKDAYRLFKPAYKILYAARKDIGGVVAAEKRAVRSFKRKFANDAEARKQFTDIDKYFRTRADSTSGTVGKISRGTEITINSFDDFIREGVKMNKLVANQYERWISRSFPAIIRLLTMKFLLLEKAVSGGVEGLREFTPAGITDEQLAQFQKVLADTPLNTIYAMTNQLIGELTVDISFTELMTKMMRFLQIFDPRTPHPEDFAMRKALRNDNVFAASLGVGPKAEQRTFKDLSVLMGYSSSMDLVRALGFTTSDREVLKRQVDEYMAKGRKQNYFIKPSGGLNEGTVMNLTEKQINEIIVEETKRVLAESRLQKLKNYARKLIDRLLGTGKKLDSDDLTALETAAKKGIDLEPENGADEIFKVLEKQTDNPEALKLLQRLKEYQQGVKKGSAQAAGEVAELVVSTSLDGISRSNELVLAQLKSGGLSEKKLEVVRAAQRKAFEQVKNAPIGTSQINLSGTSRQLRMGLEADGVEQVKKGYITWGKVTGGGSLIFSALLAAPMMKCTKDAAGTVELAADAAGLTTREVLEAQFGFPYPDQSHLHMTTGELEIGTRVKDKRDIEGRKVTQVIGFEDGNRKKPIFSANMDINDEDEMFNN
tara:strand:+ start:11099 stop:13222 length:2124 start_codon:yes stop_codon:yes gene_type:complete